MLNAKMMNEKEMYWMNSRYVEREVKNDLTLEEVITLLIINNRICQDYLQ